jgi:DNA-directed RNA polymerase subunit H (RpoH/RPB5)
MSSRDYIGQSLKTIIEMLQDRKIESGLTPDGANDLIGANLNYFEFVIFDAKNKIKVIYYLSSKFKWADLKKSFEDEPYDLYMLVLKEKPSLNNLKFINMTKLNIQIFELRELQFNISKHYLVPKHEVISDQDEVTNIIKQYSLKSKFQLPIILKTDAMAKYLNLKNGDIIKVTRVSPTAGEYIEFRCCL